MRQAGAGRGAQRVHLPPPVVERVLVWALAQDADQLARSSKLRHFFHAAVATVLTFCVFCRGDTGASLRHGEVRASAAGVSVTLDHEKGKRVDGTARVITFPPAWRRAWP